MTTLLALDFGGTKLAAATLQTPHRQQFSSQHRQLSPPNSSASTDIHQMRSLAQQLLLDTQPAAIGVSFGGLAGKLFKSYAIKLP